MSALTETVSTARIRAAALHAQRLDAARILLAQWFRGASFVAVSRGRLEPCAVPPDELPWWPAASQEAAELLVASVALGVEYAGWQSAMRQAKG